jgi:hypothetical protein
MRHTIPLLFLLMAGCAVQPVPRQARYVASEYAPYLRRGTGKVMGQAFIKAANGQVKYAAGNKVSIRPVTSANAEWYASLFSGKTLAPSPDSRIAQGAQIVVADAEGRFVFSGLPTGRYYLATAIFWLLPSGYPEGGILAGVVEVKDGQTTPVILSRSMFL